MHSGLASSPCCWRRTGAAAQTYPSQAVRIVVPFSAGSITDGLARILADKLKEMWKQEVIVENRPGLPGTTSVAKSAPDGYTLMLTSNGHTIAGVLNKSMPVRSGEGFRRRHPGRLGAAGDDRPARSAGQNSEGFHRARQARSRASSISPRPASPAPRSLSAKSSSRSPRSISCTCPYKGAPEAVTAVMRGDAQMYFAPIPSRGVAARPARCGRSRSIPAKRVRRLPDVPTVAEAGAAGLQI